MSSQTFFEYGSVVVTGVAAIGARGRVTGRDWCSVSARGAGGRLTSGSCESMVQCTNGACRVGGGAALMGVSVSRTVSKLGGAIV